jgi:hypothetical protein
MCNFLEILAKKGQTSIKDFSNVLQNPHTAGIQGFTATLRGLYSINGQRHEGKKPYEMPERRFQ